MVTSATKQERATASYTITYTVTVEVNHDTTSGRGIDSLAYDLGDSLIDSDYDTFVEDFPQVAAVDIETKSIELMK